MPIDQKGVFKYAEEHSTRISIKDQIHFDQKRLLIESASYSIITHLRCLQSTHTREYPEDYLYCYWNITNLTCNIIKSM